jgi:hypothetical protein
MCFSSAFHAKS